MEALSRLSSCNENSFKNICIAGYGSKDHSNIAAKTELCLQNVKVASMIRVECCVSVLHIIIASVLKQVDSKTGQGIHF